MVLDLAEVTFFGSAGINLLIDMWNTCQRRGVGLSVATAQPRVLKPLHITQVDQYVTICPDVDTAVAAVSASR